MYNMSDWIDGFSFGGGAVNFVYESLDGVILRREAKISRAVASKWIIDETCSREEADKQTPTMRIDERGFTVKYGVQTLDYGSKRYNYYTPNEETAGPVNLDFNFSAISGLAKVVLTVEQKHGAAEITKSALGRIENLLGVKLEKEYNGNSLSYTGELKYDFHNFETESRTREVKGVSSNTGKSVEFTAPKEPILFSDLYNNCLKSWKIARTNTTPVK